MKYIPNRDIFNIPVWDNSVKVNIYEIQIKSITKATTPVSSPFSDGSMSDAKLHQPI